MNKKLEVGQRWAHFEDDNTWAIYEIIDLCDSGRIEDAIVKKTIMELLVKFTTMDI